MRGRHIEINIFELPPQKRFCFRSHTFPCNIGRRFFKFYLIDVRYSWRNMTPISGNGGKGWGRDSTPRPPLVAIAWVRLCACLPIYLMATHKSKVTIKKVATLDPINVPADNSPLWCEIQSDAPKNFAPFPTKQLIWTVAWQLTWHTTWTLGSRLHSPACLARSASWKAKWRSPLADVTTFPSWPSWSRRRSGSYKKYEKLRLMTQVALKY